MSHSNLFCFNPNNPNFKAMLTTIAWGTGITAACVLLAVIPDKDSSTKEKICLITFSTIFAGIFSGLIGKLNSIRCISDEALMLKRARNTGIMCGLALPVVACLTYCNGKDPRNIRNLLITSTNLENIFR